MYDARRSSHTTSSSERAVATHGRVCGVSQCLELGTMQACTPPLTYRKDLLKGGIIAQKPHKSTCRSAAGRLARAIQAGLLVVQLQHLPAGQRGRDNT